MAKDILYRIWQDWFSFLNKYKRQKNYQRTKFCSLYQWLWLWLLSLTFPCVERVPLFHMDAIGGPANSCMDPSWTQPLRVTHGHHRRPSQFMWHMDPSGPNHLGWHMDAIGGPTNLCMDPSWWTQPIRLTHGHHRRPSQFMWHMDPSGIRSASWES